ncbi:5-formyltetrahydrofolate cyclo-ligase [Caulobacter sp. S45]|uniref:5-formyltetrahydrofolate cyclo-ligase n=1 Tax=Caulobacter sp. S45 TaxID=1641861 RepID=UPI001576402D|nr:5-formyltetrahydrofolate cyclo-ligase [Caulobacter sp. S45]
MSGTEEKSELRRLLRARRRELRATAFPAAEQVVEVYASQARPPPKIAAFYVRCGGELDSKPLSVWFARQGVLICLPVVAAPERPLIFREITGVLEPDTLGLPAPPPHAKAVEPDLIFVPLLGFDRTGARLGQGGGYYDRTLAARRASGPPARAIGLAYAAQEVPRIPTDAFDQRLDGVLTEREYLDFKGVP